MTRGGKTIRLVPAGQDDAAWIEELQRCIFAEALPDISESQRRPLIEMQLRAQSQQYQSDWPDSSNFLIMAEADRVGRITLCEAAQHYQLVDISILPLFRNAGFGTQVLRQLISRTDAQSKDLQLSVMKSNPALALYSRLGFEIVTDGGVYVEMKRNSGSI